LSATYNEETRTASLGIFKAIINHLTVWPVAIIESLILVILVAKVSEILKSAATKMDPKFEDEGILNYSIPGLIIAMLFNKKYKPAGGNMLLAPLTKYWKLTMIFIPILLFNIPLIVLFEELIFREMPLNTFGHSAIVVLFSSIIFGLTHSLFGIPIGTSMAIILLGLWLNGQYLLALNIHQDALITSTIYHVLFNFTAGTIFLSGTLFFKIKAFVQKKRGS